MSERTTIGGTTYESIGSSNSNLLLRCNGTARIQWGNKLIDLIKNGKIASGDSSSTVSVVSDESEIKSDGIYIVDKEKSQLWISKHGKHYNLTGTDLYISASTKQDITAEQQKQALENIGMYYDTLKDVEQAKIQNGLVYVFETKSLYTITDGIISEFEAKLKTVTVEEENEEGEVIKSSFKIVFTVLNKDYLILENNTITANCDINIKTHAQLCSEGASDTTGYRLYMDGDVACLDVDKINVRDGLPISEYIEVTFAELKSKIASNNLEPLQWYLIKDYQNPWKMAKLNTIYRPILVRALTPGILCREGLLFKDRSIVLHYDYYYQELVVQESAGVESLNIKTKGRITWMRDSDNNEANFDFLDYSDASGTPLATLHERGSDTYLDRSVFPVGSHDNKITVHNLWGTVLVNGYFNNNNAYKLDFQIQDSKAKDAEDLPGVVFPRMEMFNNNIECSGLIITGDCTSFYNNKTGLITNLTLSKNVINSTFGDINNCTFNCSFDNVDFKDLTNCIFGESSLSDIICRSNIYDYTFSQPNDPLLYDNTTYKEIYYKNGKISHLGGDTQTIPRGLIAMHSGLVEIPDGWAICDGGTYNYNGESVTTPNLINKFIKAVASKADVKETINPDLDELNSFTLKQEHLPSHSHPHQAHSHTISGLTGTINASGSLSTTLNNSNYAYNISKSDKTVVSKITSEGVDSETTSVVGSVSSSTQGGNTSGGSHIHTMSISGGTISNTTSTESTQTWTNKSFKIEPNYYSLIFIMKL